MGNDGGDIPGRKQLVRQKKKVQTPTAQSIALGRSRFCNLSKQPFKEPLAICKLGNIYNYQTLLELLVKKELPSKYQYIRKLTDIKKIIIQRTSVDSLNFIMCPITKLEYNGLNKFIAFWPCGHVVSRKAVKEVLSQEKTCILCHLPYKSQQLIDLNLQLEKAEYYRKKMLEKVIKKKQVKQQQEGKDELKKKVKLDTYVNSVDRLGGQFRDVIRNRDNFKKLFKPQEQLDWKKNTYFVQSKQVKQQKAAKEQ